MRSTEARVWTKLALADHDVLPSLPPAFPIMVIVRWQDIWRLLVMSIGENRRASRKCCCRVHIC